MRYFVCALSVCLAMQASASPPLPASLTGLGLREHAVVSRDIPGWALPTKVVVRNFFGEAYLNAFREIAPDVEVVGVRTLDEAQAAVAGAQVMIGFCTQSLFDAADQLHWVQVYSAGVETCVDQPAMKAGGMLLSNGQRLASPTLADHSIALTMALTRGLYPYFQHQNTSRWAPDWTSAPPAFGELAGRTMLVVGLGGIGTQVAKRAHGLGMRVVATRNSRREGPDYVAYVGLADEVLKLAREADVVVNASPLTNSTRGLFDEDFFKAMKPSAYFVSVGRGQSTVTADLVAALNAGDIAGAGLDVTDPEPLPQDHPLWGAPNVIITPHVAGRSREALGRMQALVLENYRRYLAGDALLSVVNIERGY
ncbi:MAG: D-2-hydroxyacid dehydrogenase [Pseudomonadota bacterium]